jgi:F420-non-reducing hydrogenase small subunit
MSAGIIMAKLKLALYWAASCGGCDVALLDINEKILDVAKIADIVFWPIAMDFKYSDIIAIEDGSIDICLFNGAIRNSEQERIARLLRLKSKILIAFGSCACFGGIPALANFTNSAEIINNSYLEAPSNDNPNNILPREITDVDEGKLELPELYDTVKTLSQVVSVEYFLPGCPPPVSLILELLNDLIENKLPVPGSTIASDKTVCDECPLKKENKCIDRIYRPQEIIPDKERCLLEQGLICCGPATRGGCGAVCIKAGMPCRGCFGPPAGIIDQGAKLVSAISSIYEVVKEDEIARMVDEIVDPAGTFYRFSLAASILKRKQL